MAMQSLISGGIMSRGTVRPVVTVLAVGFSVTLLLISDKGIRD